MSFYRNLQLWKKKNTTLTNIVTLVRRILSRLEFRVNCDTFVRNNGADDKIRTSILKTCTYNRPIDRTFSSFREKIYRCLHMRSIFNDFPRCYVQASQMFRDLVLASVTTTVENTDTRMVQSITWNFAYLLLSPEQCLGKIRR